MPLVVALIFFLVFYLLSIFGEKFTKDSVLDPITGMWLPVIVLSPVGFFLTYKAMHDSQLFNKEYYYRVIKSIRTATAKFLPNLKRK
jgi:lipopolysaccharide export system permease protein